MTLFQIEFWFLLFLPGFAITFLVKWRRSRGRPNFLKITFWATLVGAILAAIIFGGLVASFLYLMSPGETDNYKTPLTVEQARHLNCPIPLPDSARNVQFVVASGGMQALEILVCFEAPVEVCKNHVQIVSDKWPEQTSHPFFLLPLVPLNHTPPPEDHDMVGKAPWFDVDKIKRGFTVENKNDTQFWIDEDRGVFYCKITD